MIKDYGFIEPKIESSQFTFGALLDLPKVVLKSDAQWDEHTPDYEPQFGDGWDSHGCTVWGTENAVEILEHKHTGVKKNYDERFPYILAGIRPPGGDVVTVTDTMRKNGLTEGLLPMTVTYEDFIKPDPMDVKCIEAGKAWLSTHQLKYAWVFTGGATKEARTAMMKECLKYSPLGISVTAWIEKDGVYIDAGQPNTHWCVCYGFTDKGWKVFDSYDHSQKIVSFDHNIKFCMRYQLTIKKQMNTPKKIIVHHTGGTASNPVADTSHHTFEDVDAWHRHDPNVWLGEYSSLGHAIGYHYFIDKTGKVTQGRADTDEGAHCRGQNTVSIGICLAGNFDVTLPTPEQANALKSLLSKLTTKYKISIDDVYAHREFSGKSCYGKNLSDYWASDLLRPVYMSVCKAERDENMQLKQSLAWYEELLQSLWR